MADIATIWEPSKGRGDWALPIQRFTVAVDQAGRPVLDQHGRAIPLGSGGLPSAGLTTGNDIATAVLISVFTDAAAEPDEQLHDGDPRGWWGDPSIGSRVWLRQRGKQTPATLLLVKADVQAALAWLIADDVAAAVEVATEWVRPGLLGIAVTVRRTDGSTVAVSFEWAWKDLR